jgi:UDP-perosamine 4-acetyltransferase
MTDVIGLGAGGHAKVVVELLRSQSEYQIVGLLDPNRQMHGCQVSGVPVLGDDRMLPQLYARGVRHAFIGVGTSHDACVRARLYRLAESQGFVLVPAIHETAILSPSAQIGSGCTVMAGAIVQAEARLGANVIVNSGAIVEHDCRLGDDVHVASGSRIAGEVHLERGVFVGVGASARPRVRIGRWTVVGAGATVVTDLPAQVIAVGTPARIVRSLAVHHESNDRLEFRLQPADAGTPTTRPIDCGGPPAVTSWEAL